MRGRERRAVSPSVCIGRSVVYRSGTPRALSSDAVADSSLAFALRSLRRPFTHTVCHFCTESLLLARRLDS